MAQVIDSLKPREIKMELQKKVFVIMPFGDPIAHDMYTKIVRPLCDSLTLNVIRADEIFSNNVIYDDIWNGINEADIIIADISGKNPNVMYELGIAHAVKRPNTIMLTREEVTESPFDIKHIRIIGYSNDISGTKKLESDLSNTIAVLLENYKITSRNEFEFCLGLYHSVGKLSNLAGYLGLSKLSPDKIFCEEQINWTGSFKTNTFMGFDQSPRHFLIPFKALQMVDANISFTPKGKAFAEFLEEEGFECDQIRNGTIDHEKWEQYREELGQLNQKYFPEF